MSREGTTHDATSPAATESAEALIILVGSPIAIFAPQPHPPCSLA